MKRTDIGKLFAKREDKIRKLFIIYSLLFIALIAVIFLSYHFINRNLHSKPSITMLYDKWEVYDYQSVYDISSILLDKSPMNNTILTFRGYSSFYLAVSQNENAMAQQLIDESIRCLRIALLTAKKKTVAQIDYMLGKAYFYKNELSSYGYYSDLTVYYLTAALEKGYKADDVFEYLGLSYALLGKTMESIAAFSEALLVRESDSLLLSIAEQYYKAGITTISKQYLYQLNTTSDNESLLLNSMNLLGKIYIDEGSYAEAQKEYETILKKNENSADAHYGLGVIYEKQNDIIKARSEWRKALRIQVNHQEALKKMAEYK